MAKTGGTQEQDPGQIVAGNQFLVERLAQWGLKYARSIGVFVNYPALTGGACGATHKPRLTRGLGRKEARKPSRSASGRRKGTSGCFSSPEHCAPRKETSVRARAKPCVGAEDPDQTHPRGETGASYLHGGPGVTRPVRAPIRTRKEHEEMRGGHD